MSQLRPPTLSDYHNAVNRALSLESVSRYRRLPIAERKRARLESEEFWRLAYTTLVKLRLQGEFQSINKRGE